MDFGRRGKGSNSPSAGLVGHIEGAERLLPKSVLKIAEKSAVIKAELHRGRASKGYTHRHTHTMHATCGALANWTHLSRVTLQAHGTTRRWRWLLGE